MRDLDPLPASAAETPEWLPSLLGITMPEEGESLEIRGEPFVMEQGILRSKALLSAQQTQTAAAFGYEWHQRETFESPPVLARARDWLVERYGNIAAAPWWDEYGETPLLLDAGCGAGWSGIALLEPRLPSVRYLGADVSRAVEVAATRFAERGIRAGFLQVDLTKLPLPPASVDVIFSEGVLHHTDSTEGALRALTGLLKPGGRFLFYVYRRKGPIREFSDDYIRGRLQEMDPKKAWEALMPLSRLGQALGELDIEIDVPEEIPLLEIPAGSINLQRLFYWHVLKAYHDPEMTLEELNATNFDWFAPQNAFRQSPEEVRAWCADLGLEIEHEDVQDAGITIIARKRA